MFVCVCVHVCVCLVGVHEFKLGFVRVGVCMCCESAQV